MWEKKVAGGGECTTNLHAVDAGCTWGQAPGGRINAVNAEGGTGFAGYSDWRLPNVRELMSIVDYGVFGPAIDSLFGPTAAANYWSSTTYAADPSGAWDIGFGGGSVGVANKVNSFRVRAVRGGR